MSKNGSANGSFSDSLFYGQLPHRRPYFLHDLSRAMELLYPE